MLAAPALSAISDVTFFSGSAVHIPLNATDADGDSLSFNAVSDNISVSADVLEGNRSLQIAVEQGDSMSPTISGEMTFELFEDEASRATSRIITLAESGFYDGSTFHRVIDNFVIQGGDPNGVPSGTGGSTLGDFDDQFAFDLQHNRTGMLSYAKSIDDTNDSQFFVTEYADPTVVNTILRHLDSNHSVFGMQTTGEAIRAAISDTSTGANDVPNVDVVLTSVTVFVDTQNGVLRINAPEGTSGTAMVTVTVSDSSEQDQQSFNVTFAPDTHNNAPFLADIPSIRTLADTATTFQLTALDVENAPNAAFLDEVELANRSLLVPQTSNAAELTYDIGFLDGTVSVVPVNSFSGTSPITVAAGEFVTAIDYQVVPIEIVASASPWTVSATDHPGLTEANDGAPDEIRLVRNGSKFEVFVNDQPTAQAEDFSVTTLTIDGSRDDDTLIIDYSGGNPFPTGGILFNGYTVDPMEVNPPEDTGIDSLEFTGGAVTTATYTFTNAIDGSVNLDDDVLTYVGLESIADTLNVTDRVFTYSAAADMVTTGDDDLAANGLSRIATDGTGTTVDFTTPSGSLTINSGDGNDTVAITSMDSLFDGPLTVNAEDGNDTVDASEITFAVKLNGFGGNDSLTGGSIADTLNGGSGSDSLVGGAGDDKLRGQGTSGDTLHGGPGDDTLDGGDGYDHIFETADIDFTVTDSTLTGLGNDTLINIQLAQLFGGSNANIIDASAFSGRAFLNGAGGNDVLRGGIGYDRIFGGSGRDLLVGGDRDDVLRGQGGNHDTLLGGAGNDKLNGGIGHDSLVGGDDDDILTGESGNDTIDGGAGTDRLYERGNVNMTLSDTALTGGLGTDSLASVETAYLKGGNGSNLLDGSAFGGDMTLIGVGGNDTLKGGTGSDMLNGRSGADSILGGDGDDTLMGMRDDDTLNGGAGNDRLDGGSQDDALSGWTGDDLLYGRSGADILVGGDGNDSLYGASGDDILLGDDGKSDTDHSRDDDRLEAGADTDTVRGGGGADTMLDDVSEVDESFAYWAEWVDAV